MTNRERAARMRHRAMQLAGEYRKLEKTYLKISEKRRALDEAHREAVAKYRAFTEAKGLRFDDKVIEREP